MGRDRLDDAPKASDSRTRRVIGIYDADGSLRGELRYVTLHLLGRAECALCDITHGVVRRKRSIDGLREDLRSEFDVELELRHRDEVDPAIVQSVAPGLPCVVEVVGTTVRTLLSRDDLRDCGGDVERFGAALRDRLTGDGHDGR